MVQEAVRRWSMRESVRASRVQRACRCAVISGGKTKSENRPALRQILAGNLATMILDNAVGGTQAESGASANRFGGIERVKYALGFADTRTRVRKFEHHFVFFTACADPQCAAGSFLQSIHGVADDLQAALQKLVGVAPDRWQSGSNCAVNANPVALHLQHLHLQSTLQEWSDFDPHFLGG